MREVLPRTPYPPRPAGYASRLLQVIRRLEEIEDGLIADELREEAASVATVIADLYWQAEELDKAETTRRATEPRSLLSIAGRT